MFKSHTPNYSFLGLFLSFLAYLLITPFIERFFLDVFVRLWISLILISAIYTLSEKKWQFNLGLALGIPAIITSWATLFPQPSLVVLASFFINLAFLSLVIAILFQKVFLSKEIHFDLIFGALCIYLLIGMFFTFLYITVHYISPDSFVGLTQISGNTLGEGFEEFAYYSYVTLTTLGYGDITPAHDFPRNLAIIEAIIGQFYIATLVAGLLGKLVRRQSFKSK